MRRLINSKLFVGFLFALTLIGCKPAAETESATPAAGTTEAAAPATETTAEAAPATETAAPATLEAQIAAKLVEAFGDDAKTITITLVDGKATLTGKVNERSTQELAEQVALYFPEVKDADNQLSAAEDRGLGKGQLKDEAADAAIEASAKGALAKEIGEYAKDVEVEVAAGVVALRGTVPDANRAQLAVDSMKNVKEITKVINLLRTQ